MRKLFLFRAFSGGAGALAGLGAAVLTLILGLLVERVAFRLAKRGWEPAGPLLPALGQVIELLLRRSRALEAGDEAALQALGAEADPVVMGRPRTVSAWTVRVDRDRAEVLEEYRLSGEGSGPGRRRLVLVKADREFRFDARLR